MKKIFFLILVGLFMISYTGAVVLEYSGDDIVTDVYLESLIDVPEDYYAFITWDLGNDTFTNPMIDLYSIEATLSLAVLSNSGCEPNATVSLIPNQEINLSSDSVISIFNESTSVSTNHFMNSTIGNGERHSITISELVKGNLQNTSNRYLTLRIEDSASNLEPDFKVDNQELKICNNLNAMALGSSTTTTLNRPRLTISYNFIDPSNITVQPYEVRNLPQVESNKSLDLEGVERTYLRCFWHIDGIGEDFVDMNSNFCPETQQNFTFTEDEDYVVRIAYLSLIHDGVEWQEIESGISGELHYHYNLNLPDPDPGFLEGLWNSILDLIRGFICSIFPDLGFCS